MNGIYDASGTQLNCAYNAGGEVPNIYYNADGSIAHEINRGYDNYSFTQKWGSKSIGNAQGFDIYDGKVFWVSKSGNSSIPANCYVWNLADGSYAFETPYITIYSGHGNNLSIEYPIMYASPAYPPSIVYVNSFTDDYIATLVKTFTFDDGSTDCDVCIDENDDNIIWTLGHTANSSDLSAPYRVSKWDVSNLTDNGDNTYTPHLLSTVDVAQPSNSYFFQGCKFHDNILWFANGYDGSATGAYVFGVDPYTGEYLYTIDCQTTMEPEGLAWVEDSESSVGYALYIGFAGMVLRKYIFN